MGFVVVLLVFGCVYCCGIVFCWCGDWMGGIGGVCFCVGCIDC